MVRFILALNGQSPTGRDRMAVHQTGKSMMDAKMVNGPTRPDYRILFHKSTRFFFFAVKIRNIYTFFVQHYIQKLRVYSAFMYGPTQGKIYDD